MELYNETYEELPKDHKYLRQEPPAIMCARVISMCDALERINKNNLTESERSFLKFHKNSTLQSVEAFLLEVSEENPPETEPPYLDPNAFFKMLSSKEA